METVLDPRVRWVRALGAGSVAFVVGVTAHLSADGLVPGPVGLTLLLALSVALALPVLGARISTWRTVALLVGGQAGIHLALTLTAGHAGDQRHGAATPAPQGLGSLPVVDGRRVGSLQDAYLGTPDTVVPVVPGHLVTDLQAHAPMMVVHLLAAAAVGLWLAHGERLLWTVLTLTGQRLVSLAVLVVPVAVPVRSLASYDALHAPAGPRSVWLTRPCSRRGPPLLLA